jgi:hypothetical protein
MVFDMAGGQGVGLPPRSSEEPREKPSQYQEEIVRLVKLLLAIAVSCLVAADVRGTDDSIGTAVEAAKATRTESLKKADADLQADFDKAIKTVAATGDLDATKKLVNEKEAFKHGTCPQTPSLAAAVNAYRTARKGADEKLLRTYDQAIKQYTQQLRIQEGTATQEAKRELLVDEKEFLGAEPKSGTAREITLAFDQDENRIELATGDVPKEAELQIEITNPADKLAESKAKIRTNQKLLFSKEPQIEVLLEIRKSKPGNALIKVTPWLGNHTQGLPCNLSRLQQMVADLPGRIEAAQNGLANASDALKTQQHDLGVWTNGGYFTGDPKYYTPPSASPGVAPSRLLAQQSSIRQLKSHMDSLAAKQRVLAHAADRYTAQLNELPADIQLVQTLVGTNIQYRVYYAADGKEITIQPPPSSAK